MTTTARITLPSLLLSAMMLMAQAPPQPPGPPPQGGRGARGGGGGGFANAFPQHEQADPAAIERGKAIWGVQCAFCHGSDARGGEGGPNLLRSELVLNDQKGELIAPVVQNGRVDAGMPKFPLTNAQIADIAAFLHSFRVSGYDAVRNKPVSFLMPGGGRGGFGGRGVASNVPPATVTVTFAGGRKLEGRLIRIDDFTVTLAEADGTERTVRRDGASPKVEIHDPLQPHKDMLPRYTDRDIHNLTAYLVTVK